MKLVGSDKLDETTVCPFFCSCLMYLHNSPVRHKLGAFETSREKYLMWQGKVVLSQVDLQTSESNEVAASGDTEVVSRINSRFNTLTHQYLALLTVADGFCVSRLRGLWLWGRMSMSSASLILSAVVRFLFCIFERG